MADVPSDVLLVEPLPVVRAGLARLIASGPAFGEVVAVRPRTLEGDGQ